MFPVPMDFVNPFLGEPFPLAQQPKMTSSEKEKKKKGTDKPPKGKPAARRFLSTFFAKLNVRRCRHLRAPPDTVAESLDEKRRWSVDSETMLMASWREEECG